MGPRSFDRGNAERLAGQSQRFAASMGPRSFDRGNLSCHHASKKATSASMGPRSFDRGNKFIPQMYATVTISCFNGAAIFRSRKLLSRGRLHAQLDSLQWGRDLSI